MPGFPGAQGPQGRDGTKGQTGEKGSQGMLGQERKEGPRGKSGLPGMMGIKGARGIVGDQGIKGNKGEKGESVTSPSSVVPQSNWKQCVWKNLNDDRDSGKIKVRCERGVLSGIDCEQNYFYYLMLVLNSELKFALIYLVECESEFYRIFEGLDGVSYNSYQYTRLNRHSAS